MLALRYGSFSLKSYPSANNAPLSATGSLQAPLLNHPTAKGREALHSSRPVPGERCLRGEEFGAPGGTRTGPRITNNRLPAGPLSPCPGCAPRPRPAALRGGAEPPPASPVPLATASAPRRASLIPGLTLCRPVGHGVACGQRAFKKDIEGLPGRKSSLAGMPSNYCLEGLY